MEMKKSHLVCQETTPTLILPNPLIVQSKRTIRVAINLILVEGLDILPIHHPDGQCLLSSLAHIKRDDRVEVILGRVRGIFQI